MNKTLIKEEKYIWSGIALLVLAAGILTFYGSIKNNSIAGTSFVFPNDCRSAEATSTRVTLTPGAASSTLATCTTDSIDILGMNFTLEASSTATVNWEAETSQDGITWYSNTNNLGSITLNNNSTTSKQILINPFVGKQTRVQARVANTSTGTTSIHFLGLKVEKTR